MAPAPVIMRGAHAWVTAEAKGHVVRLFTMLGYCGSSQVRGVLLTDGSSNNLSAPSLSGAGNVWVWWAAGLEAGRADVCDDGGVAAGVLDVVDGAAVALLATGDDVIGAELELAVDMAELALDGPEDATLTGAELLSSFPPHAVSDIAARPSPAMVSEVFIALLSS